MDDQALPGGRRNTTGRSRRRGADRLDPVRWTRRRRSRLLRAGLATLLLVLAGGVLMTGAARPAEATRCVSTARSAGPVASPSVIPAGKVGVPVRISQPGVDGLVRPGDHIDLTSARGTSGHAQTLVRDVLVLPRPSRAAVETEGGSLLYLAMSERDARLVAGADDPDTRIGITVRPH